MIEQRHDKVIDYVLNLLPAEAQQALEKQAGQDAELRQAISDEREIVHSVRSTVGAATTPNPLRLKILMPAIPQSSPVLNWQRPMTLAGAFLLLILVAFGWRTSSGIGSGPVTLAPAVAVTLTQTESPTMTLTQTVAANNSFSPISFGFVSTRMLREPAGPAAPSPFPAATPIAALSFSTP